MLLVAHGDHPRKSVAVASVLVQISVCSRGRGFAQRDETDAAHGAESVLREHGGPVESVSETGWKLRQGRLHSTGSNAVTLLAARAW